MLVLDVSNGWWDFLPSIVRCEEYILSKKRRQGQKRPQIGSDSEEEEIVDRKMRKLKIDEVEDEEKGHG